MLPEIIEAFLKAALPLGLLSFLLFRWSLKAGRLEASSDSKGFRAGMQAMKRNRKSKTRNPLHNKWMRFGGGFYGLVGLWTFLVIEAKEIYQFAQSYEGMDGMMDTFSNASIADLGIRFLINSMMNFVSAIAWPGYWSDIIRSQNIWVWVVAAYAGYWVGMKAARQQAKFVTADEA